MQVTAERLFLKLQPWWSLHPGSFISSESSEQIIFSKLAKDGVSCWWMKPQQPVNQTTKPGSSSAQSGPCKPLHQAVFLLPLRLCWVVAVLKSMALTHPESIWELALKLLRKFSGWGSPRGMVRSRRSLKGLESLHQVLPLLLERVQDPVPCRAKLIPGGWFQSYLWKLFC